MANAPIDQNTRQGLIAVSNADGTTIVPLYADPTTHRLLVDFASAGGTVTSVSVVTANGFAGSVATATTTPAITLSTTVTGILSGNGTAISAASTTGSGAVVLANSPTFVDDITLGSAGGATGSILFTGTTSGVVTVKPADAAGTWTLTLPTNDGDSGQVLTTNGSGVTSWAAAGTSVSFGTDGQVPYMNVGGTDFAYESALTYTASTNTLTAGTLAATGPGSPTAPAFVLAGTTAGIYDDWGAGGGGLALTYQATKSLSILVASTYRTIWDALGIHVRDDMRLDWGTLGGSSNVGLVRDSAGVLKVTDGTTGFGIITAGSFIPGSSTVPTNGLYLPAANTLGWAVNSAAELQLTSTAFSPAADGGSSLGTTTLGWQNLFGNTGFVVNIENGDWVATHTTGILTVGTGDLRVTTAGTNTASVVTVGGSQTLTSKTLTAPAIGGTALLAEGASIGLDPSASADGAYSGITITGTSGYAQSFGDVVYLDPTDSRWEACDANAAAGADGDSRGMVGMVVVAGTDGNSCTILLQGVIRADANFPTFTVNNPIYISETAGDVTQTQPVTTDVVIRFLGAALTADSMYFDPDKIFYTHT